MALTFGPAKSLDDISLDDVLKHPVWLWVWETGQEGAPDQDETWQRPVTSTRDVTDEMRVPTVTLRVKGTDLYGSGEYHREHDRLEAISLWIGTQWRGLTDAGVQAPLTFIVIPRIRGQADVEFECNDLRSDEAYRAA